MNKVIKLIKENWLLVVVIIIVLYLLTTLKGPG